MALSPAPRPHIVRRVREQAVSKEWWDRGRAAAHKYCPADMLELLVSRHEQVHVRSAAARNANLCGQTLLGLVTDLSENRYVVAAACANPSLTSSMIRAAFNAHATNRSLEDVRGLLVHPACPKDRLAVLIAKSTESDRAFICANPGLSRALQVALARDTSPRVRKALARHPNLHSDALAILECDKTVGVLVTLLDRGYRGTALLEHARASRASGVAAALIRHGLASDSVIQSAATSKHKVARRAAAPVVKDPDTMTSLALDDDAWVRYQVLRHNKACPDEAKVAAVLSGKAHSTWFSR